MLLATAFLAFLAFVAPATAQKDAASSSGTDRESRGARLVLVPAAGGSFNKREQRLPVSPTAYLRLSLEMWNAVNGFDFAVFLGGAATGVVVASCPSGTPSGDECSDGSPWASATDFVATAEVGLILGIPGEPYLVGYWGQGFPAKREAFNLANPSNRRYRRFSWGGGGGITPQIGQLPLLVEVRFRRDGRYPSESSDSFEVLLGVPLRSG